MKVEYVTDQFLPTDATDTIQLVTMASAMGSAGARVRLIFPCKGPAQTELQSDVDSIAGYYGVAPTFDAVPLRGPYPAPLGFRGMEKLAHAGLAVREIRRASGSGDTRVPDRIVYTRN